MNNYEALDGLWSEPDGVFYRLRQGELTSNDAEQVLVVLRQVKTGDEANTIPRRLVELTWYVPLFVSWQRSRVEQQGGDLTLLASLLDECTNEVERILGLP